MRGSSCFRIRGKTGNGSEGSDRTDERDGGQALVFFFVEFPRAPGRISGGDIVGPTPNICSTLGLQVIQSHESILVDFFDWLFVVIDRIGRRKAQN